MIVAIVGRPNTGKSTLFNRIVRKGASAITESTPGVTRDRNYGNAEWEGKHFTIIDTGGFYGEEAPLLSEGFEKGLTGRTFEGATVKTIVEQVKEQALLAVEEADIIIHLLDGKEGLTPSDKELAALLRKSGKKVLWVVNKVDIPKKEDMLLEFYPLGVDELVPVSAITGYGFEELMDKIAALVPAEASLPAQELGEEIPKIAVVGRPNVGKSTLINALLSKKRLIVSPIPGTTRDAVDALCTYYGKKYLFIDTAGIRKRGKGYAVEHFSVVRALKSIERADLALIVLDATDGVVEQDQRISGIVQEYGRSALFLVNKWDLVENPEEAYKKLEQQLRGKIWFMPHVPFITISGLEKKRITKIFPLIDQLMHERKKRIATSALNRFVAEKIAPKAFPGYKGRPLKVFYMTQVGTEPPAFSIFVNYPSLVKERHIKFIESALREKFSFIGTPLRIHVKSR